MSRLIDADTLMRDIDKDLFNTESRKCYEKLRVRRQPVIDAEPVRHGRYGFVGMDMMAGTRAFYFGTCSECRERINFEYKHKNYCPNCGAKMDLEV